MKLGKIKALYWLPIVILLVGIATLIGVARQNHSRYDGTWKQSDLALGREPVYQDSIEEVAATLKSTGFVPAELHPRSNRFLLSLDNRTDLKEIVLRLTASDGTQIREMRVPGGGGDWSELFELQPGTYVLSEANHKNWVCNIVIRKK